MGDFYEIVELLIHSGSNTELKNNDDKTALDLAKERKNNKIIKLLSDKSKI